MGPWSKLQREISKLIDPAIRFQIHCAAYRMDSQRGSANLPRYWITLGRAIIWDYPRDFIERPRPDRKPAASYPYATDVPDISALIREYIDTPKDVLLNKRFTLDYWGLADILRAADRRLGRRSLEALRSKTTNEAARQVIDRRLADDVGKSGRSQMAKNKTTFTGASVDDYIAARANAQQNADCRELMALFKKVTRQTPRMWGPSIVGYGSQKYTFDSGRTGEMPLAAFAIRGRELVVYVSAEGQSQRSLLNKVGKHSMGKTCLYFKRLADLDRSVLEKIVVGSIAEARRLRRGRGSFLMASRLR